MTSIAIVKGDAAEPDRTWMTFPDGETRQVAVHVIHDLPHLVVESVFDIGDGLWGVLAQGGFAPANRAAGGRGASRVRLVTDAPLDDLAQRHRVGHMVAKTVTNAVVNRWGEGPDTAHGVRSRLEPGAALVEPAARKAEGATEGDEYRRGIRELLERLDDDTIERAIQGVRSASALWAGLAPGAVLHLEWPLSEAFFDTRRRIDGG